MDMMIVTKTVPLHFDAVGVLRVGGTRMSLDSVLAAFHDGATPEEIVQQYDAVSLADVYAVSAPVSRHLSRGGNPALADRHTAPDRRPAGRAAPDHSNLAPTG